MPKPPNIDADCTHSLVSPAYITGSKKEDAVKVVWKYKHEQNGKWRVVGTDSVGVCADTWWWTEIDLHVQWNEALQAKDIDLALAHRTVKVQFATINAAGKMTAIPTEVTITWDVVEGDVQYHDPLVEHLVQEGDEMIFSPADPYELDREVEVEDTYECWLWDGPVPQNVVHTAPTGSRRRSRGPRRCRWCRAAKRRRAVRRVMR